MSSFSIESSENEHGISNLYKKVAYKARESHLLICKQCGQGIEKFEKLVEHSKRNKEYGCKYLFVSDSERVRGLVGPEGRKVFCSECGSELGEVMTKEAKCSCFSRQSGRFKLFKRKIRIKE